jgi:penicillin-binding protein 1A
MRARYLEKNYAKPTIMECYLNTIPLGHGTYGVEVAANYYFGKSANELTLLECATLASITKSPTYYAPDTYPDNNETRRNTVLYQMLDQGYITKEEYDMLTAWFASNVKFMSKA